MVLVFPSSLYWLAGTVSQQGFEATAEDGEIHVIHLKCSVNILNSFHYHKMGVY